MNVSAHNSDADNSKEGLDSQTILEVCSNLKSEYGNPRHSNPEKPLDDLIFILLSNRTPPDRAERVFDNLKQRCPDWNEILQADFADLVNLLRPAGLAEKRAEQIRGLLTQIRNDFGDLESSNLWNKEEEDLLDYLTTLPGVSDKVARCVMMYTLGHEVLPVDRHVHRVAYRLGWTEKEDPRRCHDELETLIPPNWRYSFHVTSVAHGRDRCRPSNPLCEECPIRRHCDYFDSQTSKE